MEDEFEEIDEEIEIDENIKKDPYNYICNYYESLLPFIGKKVFSILSLVPVSLIIPKIPRGKKKIKQKINLLLLSSPGSGKSSIAEEFEKITYFPLSTKKITPARLYHEIKKRADGKLSLIIEDIAEIFSDDVLIKLLEGILGEEGSISRDTMRNIKDEETKKKIDAIAYLSGTPENIAEKRIRDGLLMRTSPQIIFYSLEEHKKILDFVADSMGKIEKNITQNNIKGFYRDLYKIQDGTHDSLSPIEGYIIPKEINDEVKLFIQPLVEPIFLRWGISNVRELEEMYRFMCAYSFLNIYNREIKENKLVITKEDLEVAKKLIKRELRTKNIILSCIERVDYYNIKTRQQLREWEEKVRRIEKKEIPQEAKFIMDGMVKWFQKKQEKQTEDSYYSFWFWYKKRRLCGDKEDKMIRKEYSKKYYQEHKNYFREYYLNNINKIKENVRRINPLIPLPPSNL